MYKKIENEGSNELFYNTYYLLGDSAYPNRSWLISPYKNYGNLSVRKKKWNFYYSQTRVVIEHSFGLLKGRWRRLLYLNVTNVERAPYIILACCVLHNFCLINSDILIEIIEKNQFDNTDQVGISQNVNINDSGDAKREELLNIMVP